MSDCTGTGSENTFDLNVPVDDTPHIPASAHFCTSTVNPFSSPFAASNPFAEHPIHFQPTILMNQDIEPDQNHAHSPGYAPSSPSYHTQGNPPPVPPRLRRHARLPVRLHDYVLDAA